MQITPNDLLDESRDMALELRMKDRAIAALDARVAGLTQQLAELQPPATAPAVAAPAEAAAGD
jgi:hypothetical protein